MDKRDANIDLVFRNGLKDFEVLPPPEVWERIQPVVPVPKNQFLLLRAAAAAAVVISVGIFAYKLTNTPVSVLEGSSIAANEVLATPQAVETITLVPVLKVDKQNINNTKKVLPAQELRSEPLELNGSIKITPSPLVESESLSLRRINLISTPINEIPVLSEAEVDITKPVDESHLIDVSTLKENNRWSITALASPSYYSKFSTGNTELAKELMGSEKNLMSYSGGVSFIYKVSSKFSIQSGISYSSIGQMIDGIMSFGGFQKYDYTKGDRNFEILTSSGLVYTNNSDVYLMGFGKDDRFITSVSSDVFDPGKAKLQYINGNLRQNLSYLEVPVMMRYKIIDRLIDLNLIGGLSYNMLVKNSVSTFIDGDKYMIGKTDGLNTISVSSSLGMGMEYTISSKMTFNVEPTVRYYINPFSQSGGLNVHPYSLGLFSGISYRF